MPVIYKIFKFLIGLVIALFGLFICTWLLTYADITGAGIKLSVNIFNNLLPAFFVFISGFNLLILGIFVSYRSLNSDKNTILK